ncbi:hypothetical protein [Thiohalomonas denitrificans]|uniref:hypothetical protein n=1 Tax=Thiohalomonas denitrificans TaxID=415747 RepID=UPI0026ECB5DF|nr:hypothetical protein [Thiohalomonas denitrificans]
MRRQDPENRVFWGGQGSLDPAVELFKEKGSVEIEMPAELHHAVFSHLCSGARESQVEQIDQEGDADLLERIAEIGQLADLRVFLPLARERHARVSIRSPAPHLTIQAED